MAYALPSALYRTQHGRSFTYHGEEGFQSRGRYFMTYSHWLNKGKIVKHLNWRDRSLEPTPFISFTSDEGKPISIHWLAHINWPNLDHAQYRADLHVQQGIPGVFIATINTGGFWLEVLEIKFSDTAIELPTWVNPQGVRIFSMVDAARHFNIPFVQASEWLVIEDLPSDLIISRTRWN